MKLRIVKALLAPVLVLGTVVSMAAPATATDAGVLVCAVAGTVAVEPGVGRIPPGANNDGGYTFTEVELICVGDHGMVGVGAANSTGLFGVNNCDGVDYPLVGSFCGGYTADQFNVDGGSCQGNVGGNEMAMAGAAVPGNPATIPTQVSAGDWSITFGPLITGGITCDTGFSYSGGVGVLLLDATPNPLSIGGAVNTGGTCGAPPPLGSPVPDPASIYFCEIIVAGVAVMDIT